MRNYFEIPSLEHVYLEDSYVIGIALTPGKLTFTMDFVLTPENPAYRGAKPNEQYDYAPGVLTFTGVDSVSWPKAGQTRAAQDADGAQDFGNIDGIELRGGTYSVFGAWGEMKVTATGVTARLLDAETRDLRDIAAAVSNRESFAQFLGVMVAAARKNPEQWENDTIAAYLDGMSGFINDLDGFYANTGRALPSEPSWEALVEIFLAARNYE